MRRLLAELGIRSALDAWCMLGFTAALITFGIICLNSI